MIAGSTRVFFSLVFFASLLVKLSSSCICDWRILGHVFKISLEGATRGIIQLGAGTAFCTDHRSESRQDVAHNYAKI